MPVFFNPKVIFYEAPDLRHCGCVIACQKDGEDFLLFSCMVTARHCGEEFFDRLGL